MTEEGWKEKSIGDVLTLEYGKPLPPLSRNANGEYAVYGANGIKDRSDSFYVDKPSIIVGRKGSAGEITLTEDKFWPLDVTYYVTFDEAKYDLQFLYHLLSLQDLTKLAKGVKPGINRNEVYAKKVRVPSLSEQRRIVAALNEALSRLAAAAVNARKNLDNARELFDSYLNSVFEKSNEKWENCALDKLCEDNRVITYGVIKLGQQMPDGVPCLRTSNVRWLRIDIGGIKRISLTLSNEYRRTVLRGGEVLVNVRGTLGGVAVAAPEMKGWNVSREVAVVPVDANRIEPEYLAYFIATRRSQNWLTNVQKGLAYVGINIADLRTLPVSFPKREVQTKLVDKLEKLSGESRRLEATYVRRLAKIDDLRNALLHAAFSGKLNSPPSLAIREAAE